jgi:hypothetical protein
MKTVTLAVIGLLLLAYTCARAFSLALVHDEGVSYLLFVYPGMKSVMDCYSSNNHFLNTILMFVSSAILGNSEPALRLPNLVAHVIYLVATVLLVRKRFGLILSVCCFVALNINPFVLDFFSLARGYGIGMALMVLGIYWFLEFLRGGRHDQRLFLRALWCAGLAVFAHMTFLNFAVSLLCVYFIVSALALAREQIPAWQIIRSLVKSMGFFYKHLLLMAIVIVPILLNFRREKMFYYGGNEGFWQDTVLSLIGSTFYDKEYPVVVVVAILLLVMGITAVALIYLVRQVRRKEVVEHPDLFVMTCITLFVALLSVAQHHLLGILYPLDRTAIYFIPLFTLMSIFLLEVILSSGVWITRMTALAACCVVVAGMVLNAWVNTNLTHSFVWSYDMDTSQAMLDLDADRKASGMSGLVRFGVSWEFEPSVNYYFVRRNLKWMDPVTREGLSGAYDYYYALPKDRAELLTKKVRIIREYPLTGNILAANDSRLHE